MVEEGAEEPQEEGAGVLDVVVVGAALLHRAIGHEGAERREQDVRSWRWLSCGS
jgi:hypothetical protein